MLSRNPACTFAPQDAQGACRSAVPSLNRANGLPRPVNAPDTYRQGDVSWLMLPLPSLSKQEFKCHENYMP